MKIYELTQEDLNKLFERYREVTHTTTTEHFKTPNLWEVKEELIKSDRYEQRDEFGDLPDSKIKIYKKPNGEIQVLLQPNQFRETQSAKRMEQEFNKFVREYLASRTKKGLP